MPKPEENSSLDEFKSKMSLIERPRILLTGAKAWEGSFNPDYSAHVPNGDWVTTDIEAGSGVDIVSDLQKLPAVLEETFDGVYCPATLEHIERPWCAMHEMSRCLKPGGFLFIDTHQTFPLHGYPHDYFRFSTEALNTLCFDSGLITVTSEYSGPCSIVPVSMDSVAVWNYVAKSYLNVSCCAVKPERD